MAPPLRMPSPGSLGSMPPQPIGVCAPWVPQVLTSTTSTSPVARLHASATSRPTSSRRAISFPKRIDSDGIHRWCDSNQVPSSRILHRPGQGSSQYFVNGLKRIYGVYHSISGNTLTIIDSNRPQSDDTHELYAS